jgi:hypothetical protein
MIKINKWTLGLAAVGLVSLPAAALAEEQLSPVQTALDSTVISGYVNTSAQWDFGTGNYGAPRYSYNSGKQDGFNLNAVKLTVERPLSETQWAAGYKVDLMFGPDADTFGSTLDGADVDNFAVRQAYVALRTPVGNGLDFKIGVFDAIVGYESTDAGSNPNMTRSWAYTIEPFSHTGVLGSYKFNDMITAQFGIADTFGPGVNERAWSNNSGEAESFKSYMGSLNFTAPESMGFLAGSTLYAAILTGFDSAYITNHSTHYYVGGTLATPVEGFRLGAAYDYKDIHDAEGSDGYAWAVAGYLTFQATEKLSLHARGEYFASSVPIGAETGLDSFGNTVTYPVGMGSKMFSATGTIQYDLWKNVMTRLEFRWDHAADGSEPFGGETAVDLADGWGKQNNYMLAANVIYKF